MRFQPIRSADDLAERVDALGFLPFSRSGIDGLSVEELTPAEFWFVRDVEGPWEWRQQAIGRYAYGKLLGKNAGFVSLEWFPALCNYRRDGLDFDARYEDGRVPALSKRLYDLLERAPRSTVELKALAPGAEKGFDRAITALMMSTDAVITGFDFKLDGFGRPYGWGVSRYATADSAFGALTRSAAREAPEDSLARMRAHLLEVCPGADGARVDRLLRA